MRSLEGSKQLSLSPVWAPTRWMMVFSPQFVGLNRLIGFLMVMEANLLKEAAARAEAQGRFVYLPFPDDVVDEASPASESQLSFWQGMKTSAFCQAWRRFLRR